MIVVRVDCTTSHIGGGSSAKVELDDGSVLLSNCGSYLNACTCPECCNLDLRIIALGAMVPVSRRGVGLASVRGSSAKLPPINPPTHLPPPPPVRGLGWPWFTPISFPSLEEIFVCSTKPPESTHLPPQNCKACNHRNEYAGPEHLIEGVYYCRQCTPKAKRLHAAGLLK